MVLLKPTSMNQTLTKTKQIENLLSQKIRNIYKYQLEHQLDDISLKIFDRTLIVILEGTITSPEKLLTKNDRLDLAKKVRKTIDLFIRPQIKNIIEEVLEVKVIDFLSDTTIENNCTGAIAILEFKPKQAVKS